MASKFFRVHEAAVQSFKDPGQPVSDMVWDVARATRDVGKLLAPERTGTLKRSIGANRPKPYGPYQTASLVYANAKHAYWVHEGTNTITPVNGKYLTVPKFRQGGGINPSGADLRAAHTKGTTRLWTTRISVQGQSANPYLEDALQTAMRGNRYLSVS